MKPVLVFLFLAGLMIRSPGQALITDDSVVLKKGIYKDFYEFKYNRPSIGFDSPVVASRFASTNFNIRMDREAARALGEIYGFCDGTDIYLGFGERLNSKTFFYKVFYRGRYCLFHATTLQSITIILPGMPVIPITYKDKGVILLDMNTGTIAPLTPRNLKRIIREDPEIYRRYLSEKDSLFRIFIEYATLHRDDISRSRDDLTTGDINGVLMLRPDDSTYTAYYDRVIATLTDCRDIISIDLLDASYINGNPMMTGLRAVHRYGPNHEFKYKVGYWRFYDRDGNLMREVTFDINGHDMASYTQQVL